MNPNANADARKALIKTLCGKSFLLIQKMSKTSHIEFNHGLRSNMTRLPQFKNNQPYWIKEIIGSSNTERELEALIKVWNIQEEKQAMPHVASFHTINGATEGMQIIMKDYGLTLDDWGTVFTRSSNKSFFHPAVFIRIICHLIEALREMHACDFLHCDIKSDNVCIPVKEVGVTKGTYKVGGMLDVPDLHIIDLGYALLPDIKGRRLWGAQNNDAPNGSYISPRFTSAVLLAMPAGFNRVNDPNIHPDIYQLTLEWLTANGHIDIHKPESTGQTGMVRIESLLTNYAQENWKKRGFSEPLQGLDWRIDFYSLAKLVDQMVQVALTVPSNLVAVRDRAALDRLQSFSTELMTLHDDDLPSEYPHSRLRKTLEDFLEKQNFFASAVSFRLDLEKFCKHDKDQSEFYEADAAPMLLECLGVSIPEDVSDPPPVAATLDHTNVGDTSTGLDQDVIAPTTSPSSAFKAKHLRPTSVLWVAAFGVLIAALLWKGQQVWNGNYTPAWNLNDKIESAAVDHLYAFPQHPGAKFKAALWAGSEQGAQTQFAVGESFRFTATNPLPTVGYLTVFAADAQDVQAKQLRVVMRGQQMLPGAQVSFPGELEAANPSWKVQGPPGAVQMVAVVTPTPIEWSLAASANQTPVISVLIFKNTDDITALFNCAAQTGKAAQDCQYATQNFAASPVMRYQVVAATAPQSSNIGTAPAVAQIAPFLAACRA